MNGTYGANIQDWAIHLAKNFGLAFRSNTIVIFQALQEIILNVGHVDKGGDFLEQALAFLTAVSKDFRARSACLSTNSRGLPEGL